MCLQNLLIKQIQKDFISKSVFRKELKSMSFLLSTKDRFYIDNIMIYYCSLFRTKVDVETDAIAFSSMTEEKLMFLQRRINSHNCQTSKKLVELIKIKVDYVKGLKTLRNTGS